MIRHVLNPFIFPIAIHCYARCGKMLITLLPSSCTGMTVAIKVLKGKDSTTYSY